MELKPAVFLDRDGVLCVNKPDYIKSTSELRLFPWTPLAMQILAKLDAYIFVFTNQSAVGRGIISEKTAKNINLTLKIRIAALDGRIDDIFMCPHAPKDDCDCRKPKPGMIFQAFEKYPDIDTNKIAIVGDSPTDFVHIPGVITRNYLVQSGLTKNLPTGWRNAHAFPPSVLEAAYQIMKWQNAPNSNSIAKSVART